MILLIIRRLSPTLKYEVDEGAIGVSATPGRARWKKSGDTLGARRRVMGFCAQGPRLGIPPCAKTDGTLRGLNGLQALVGENGCGRCSGHLRKVSF